MNKLYDIPGFNDIDTITRTATEIAHIKQEIERQRMRELSPVRGERLEEVIDKIYLALAEVNARLEALEQDAKLRAEYPAVQRAWDKYQATKDMCI